MRSRYTFSRKGNTGKVLVRSSLYKFASTRDLCGPAAARMQHVTAASRAWASSCSDTCSTLYMLYAMHTLDPVTVHLCISSLRTLHIITYFILYPVLIVLFCWMISASADGHVWKYFATKPLSMALLKMRYSHQKTCLQDMHCNHIAHGCYK